MSAPVTIVPKMWGREVILHNGEYCAKFLIYDGVRTSSLHYHKEKHETFVVVDGEFEIEWFDVEAPKHKHKETFGVGKSLVLAPFTAHRVKCISEGGTIFEASSYDDPDDCERLEPSVNPFGPR